MLSALAVFVALSLLLRVGPWRAALLGSADNPSLPAPLIATLAMTTLLSAVPPLKQLDGWILSTFLSWGAIPAEVKRRAATMTPASFFVSDEDVTALRDSYGDGSYGDTLANHLCARGSEGLAQSQYRFTRVVQLYDQIKKLAGEPGYSRFFSEADDEFAALESKVALFLRRSDASLTLAQRLHASDAQGICEELLQERREIFAESCRDMFGELTLFLARAILRSETTEMDIVGRLRKTGFATSEPIAAPHFPIDSLTVLALAMFAYLVVVSVFFAHLPGAPHSAENSLLMCGKITLARLIAVAVTRVVDAELSQVSSFARRNSALLRICRLRHHCGGGLCRRLPDLPPRGCEPACRPGQRSAGDPAQRHPVRHGGTVLRRLARGCNSTRLAALRRSRCVRQRDGSRRRPHLCGEPDRIAAPDAGCLDRTADHHGARDRRLGAAHLSVCQAGSHLAACCGMSPGSRSSKLDRRRPRTGCNGSGLGFPVIPDAYRASC